MAGSRKQRRRRARQRRVILIAAGMLAVMALILLWAGSHLKERTPAALPAAVSYDLAQQPQPAATLAPVLVQTPAPTPEITPAPTPAPTFLATPAPTPLPDADIPIAIYIPVKGSQNRRIVNGFGSEWVRGKDIDCFEVLLSEEKEEAGSRFYEIFDRLWAAQPQAEGHRIGYELQLTLKKGSTHSHVILKPQDVTDDFFAYVECYLYDDIHQNGAWEYYHLLPNSMKGNTMITSIKLTAGAKIDQVEDIQLTAFLYRDADDFNSAGRYAGGNFWTIGIHRK